MTPDPRLLGQLLNLQSFLDVMPDEEGMLRFLCRGLAKFPGVRRVSAVRNGRALRVDRTGTPAEEAVQTHPADGEPDELVLPVTSRRYEHGFLVLEIEDAPSLDPYLPYLRNLAGFLAVVLDNRRHLAEIAGREQRLSAILDNIADGILALDGDGRIESVNAAAGRIFGAEPARLTSRPFADLLARGQDLVGLPGDGHRTEAVGQRGDGTLFPLEVSFSLAEGGDRALRTVVVRDVTERRRADEALRASEARFRLLADAAPIPIVVTSFPDGILLYVNQAASRIVGLPKEDLTGVPVHSLYVHPEERAALLRQMEAHHEVSGYETRLQSVSGRQVPVVVSACRTEYEGRAAITASFTDVTELKETQADVIAARERADAANRLKSHFLANMSHELRTPLNAIIGFSEALLSGAFGEAPPKYGEYVSDILHSGRHLLGLVNDILDMAKIEAGRLDLHLGEVRVADLVDECLGLVAGAATAKGIRLASDEVPARLSVAGDAKRLRQVLLNLLSNAVKFTPEGGSVRVAAQQQDQEVALSVQDDGIGMSAEGLRLALEPFGQIDSDLGRRHEGTGLGLPLAMRLIELHGGRMEIVSTEGAGTTVTVVLARE